MSLLAAPAGGETPERIVRAAVQDRGAVWSVPIPGRHGDVLRLVPFYVGPDEQGFLTSTGRFVGRREARKIAEAAGQLLPNARQHSELFSEDVWETPETGGEG